MTITDALRLPASLPAITAFEFLGMFGVIGPVADYRGQLWPSESAHIAGAVEKRQREYSAARHFARLAANAAGQPIKSIDTAANGAPDWPSRITGSLSHTRDLAVAVVASARRFTAMGVDLQGVGEVTPEIQPLILTATELSLMDSRSADDRGLDDLPTLLFSAKEAVYKAMNPLVNHFIDYTEVTITPDPQSWRFNASFVERHESDALLRSGRGYFTRSNGHYLCVFLLPLA